MKKTLITLAVLAAATGVAQAQSSVVIYGTVDAGFVSERGGKAGTVNKIDSGIASASRIGFKGTEDLGSGLSALFVLESGFKVDSGSQEGDALFGRQAYVGLSSKTAGTVTLGRQYTPWYNTLSKVADPFAAGYSGSAKNLFPAATTRTSNTVLYTSPNFSGFDADVAYSAGNNGQESLVSSKIGRQMGASVGYANGPLNARVAYNTTSNETAISDAGSARNWLVAANYDFTVVKAYAAYGVNKGANSSLRNNGNVDFYNTASRGGFSDDSTTALIGATVPVGPAGTVMASVIHVNDKSGINADANQFALGYSYALSKRTSTYASYAKISNKNNAGYTVGNNSNVGSGDQAFNVGVRHSF
ncbi:porin [Janthinobacterium sp. BJB312]|uniref:porin n=1 Tax=Janthinobacterium sp. BJB401 TaxID=2745934 RepID=UPI000C0E2DA7|nr:porin [Janthinobacterium sp. BJB401]NVI81250.1 porin [Janthinobacterium sp. BJB401]PHV31296.1 porin [Janthinobacterium sp. BJB312]